MVYSVSIFMIFAKFNFKKINHITYKYNNKTLVFNIGICILCFCAGEIDTILVNSRGPIIIIYFFYYNNTNKINNSRCRYQITI